MYTSQCTGPDWSSWSGLMSQIQIQSPGHGGRGILWRTMHDLLCNINVFTLVINSCVYHDKIQAFSHMAQFNLGQSMKTLYVPRLYEMILLTLKLCLHDQCPACHTSAVNFLLWMNVDLILDYVPTRSCLPRTVHVHVMKHKTCEFRNAPAIFYWYHDICCLKKYSAAFLLVLIKRTVRSTSTEQ